jgi:hypothetical protein
MVRLHSKSFEIDSSHMEDGEVKIRIELTSVEAQRRDRSWMVMVPLGCVAIIFGVLAGIGYEWVPAACFGAAAALCFASIGQGRWRHYLRIALVIAVSLLLALGIYFKVTRGHLGHIQARIVSHKITQLPRESGPRRYQIL